jgi:hypothetical protein
VLVENHRRPRREAVQVVLVLNAVIDGSASLSVASPGASDPTPARRALSSCVDDRRAVRLSVPKLCNVAQPPVLGLLPRGRLGPLRFAP